MQRHALLLLALALSGCDLLGIESGEIVAARRDAEGRAVGAACRHADRAIEDCYVLNKKVDKASMFAGWREMNDYMRENKIDPVAPQYSGPAEHAPKAAAEPDDAKKAAKPEAKPKKTDA